MSKTKSDQSRSNVGHDQAGRDIIKTTYVNKNDQPQLHMKRLNDWFSAERLDDPKFKEVLDIIKHFRKPVDGDEIISLEEKLQNGERDDIIQFAQDTKEMFSKKLVEYTFYESAQHIFECLLSEIYTRFHQYVRPRIIEKRSRTEIDEIVQDKILEPIRIMLGDNLLDIYSYEIVGMVYWLTGNCHLKWSN